MTKNKSNLKSPRLTKGVKNLLKEKAGVVLFEREADKYPKKVVISNKSKEVKINIVSDPLDVYASPHILDLSRLRFIERYQSAGLAATAAYNDLPVGDVLSKLFIFDFLAFEKSEILLALKLIWQKTFNSLRDSFYPVDFSPKLPLLNRKSDWQEKLADWQEISFVNFIVFIYSFVAKVFSFCYWLGYLAGQIIADYFRKKDEVIKMAPESAQAIKIEEKTTDIFAEPEIFIPIQETRQVFAPEFHPLAGFFRKIRQTDFSARLPELNWGINFDFKRLSVQPVAVFILIALAVVMPIKALNYWQKIGEVKGLVLGEADAAIRNLESAQGELYNFNLDEAKDYFVSANKNFISAQAQLKEIQSFLTVLAELSPADNTWRAGKNLLDLGANLSSAGSHLLNGLNGLADLSQVIDEKFR